MSEGTSGPPKFGMSGKIKAAPKVSYAARKIQHEVFEDPPLPDLAFNHRWTVWEQYENKGMKDYVDTMMKVAWFGDAITFWRVWNKIPHSDPKNFFSFYKDGKQYVNYYEIKGDSQKVTCLSLFKTGVDPAWEDKVNKKGGEFATKVEADKEKVKKIWNLMVLDMVTDNFPSTETV